MRVSLPNLCAPTLAWRQRLYEDLVLRRLAAEQTLEVADPLLQIVDPGCADDILFGLGGGMSTLLLKHTMPVR